MPHEIFYNACWPSVMLFHIYMYITLLCSEYIYVLQYVHVLLFHYSDNLIYEWDIATGTFTRTLTGHSRPVTCIGVRHTSIRLVHITVHQCPYRLHRANW